MTPEEAYRILEVPSGAAPDVVQEAYRKAALRTHPDRAEGYGLHDKKEWLRVRDAYEYLRTAGFPAALPQPDPLPPKKEKRYKAPEWLERQWEKQGPERIGENFTLDDHERHALRATIGWIFLIAMSIFLVFYFYRAAKGRGEWAPRTGVSVRW